MIFQEGTNSLPVSLCEGIEQFSMIVLIYQEADSRLGDSQDWRRGRGARFCEGKEYQKKAQATLGREVPIVKPEPVVAVPNCREGVTGVWFAR